MAVERTLSIVKPDAVAKNLIGEICSRFENNGLAILASKMLRLSEGQAQGFYAEHAGKPFYDDLVVYMTSGPVVVQVLEGEGAVALNRKLMIVKLPVLVMVTLWEASTPLLKVVVVPAPAERVPVELISTVFATPSKAVTVLLLES